MNYARNTFLNRQLPSYAGLLVLLVAVGITLILSGNTYVFVSRATIGSDPQNIQISNISGTSFTISYITDTSATGTISYGTDASTPDIALDDRDQQASSAAEHQVHFVTINNLTPQTNYYYVIDSGSQKEDNNGSPFEITTASQVASPSAGQEPIVSGSVSLSDGSIPTEGIVYLSTTGSQQIATLLKPDGTYQIPLNELMNSTFSQPASLTPDSILQLQVVTATEQSSAKVLESQASQVPKIVLPQNYDFTLGTSQVATSSGQVASISAFPVLATPAPVSSPEITSPTNAQAFSEQQPTFTGRAIPNTEVDITIQSAQEISVKLQSDDTGSWQFRPPLPLAPGNHTITIKSVDASGILQTLSRSFVVYASGSKFVEPSVSPTASSSAPLLFPSPTAMPTPTLTPTPTASPTAVPTPAPTVETTPVPAKSLPKTGSSTLITGIIAAATTIGIGALLFFAL